MPPELKARLPDTKPVWQDAVEASQSDYFAEHGKYQQFKKDTIENGTEVNEYVGPLGAGYISYEYKEVDGQLFCRATNVGPETWQGHDWIPYNK